MVVYIVSKPGITNLSRGVFTNRLRLFESLLAYAEKDDFSIKFDGIIGYSKKKFNYDNFRILLKSIDKNESFGLLMTKKDVEIMCEVCKMDTNTLLLS